jgi:glutaredoxin
MSRLLTILALLLALKFGTTQVWADAPRAAGAGVVVHVFHTATCPHCARALRFLEALATTDRRIVLDRIELADSQDNARAFEVASRRLGIEPPAVPLILVGEEVVLGYDDDATTGRVLEHAITACLTRSCPDRGGAIIQAAWAGHPDSTETRETNTGVGRPRLPETIWLPLVGDISPRALSLPTLTVVLGAIDGFNPCAMWVLVFLIGLLVGMRDPVRMWTYGSVFLIASATVYLAFMTAWLNLFLVIGSLGWIRTAIGLVALAAAAAYLWQFLTNPEAACTVTSPGDRQRTMDRLRAVVAERSFPAAIAGLVAIAVAVNLVELVCSAGVPAVYTEVLAQSRLSTASYYAHLLLYISVFLLDDVIVFVTAMVTLRATGLAASYARYSHLLGALVLAALGLLLLLRPEWLALG